MSCSMVFNASASIFAVAQESIAAVSATSNTPRSARMLRNFRICVTDSFGPMVSTMTSESPTFSFRLTASSTAYSS